MQKNNQFLFKFLIEWNSSPLVLALLLVGDTSAQSVIEAQHSVNMEELQTLFLNLEKRRLKNSHFLN